MAEDVCLAVGADDLGHVGQRRDHLLGDVDISVFCCLVLLFQQCVIDVHVAGLALAPHEDAEVLVCHALLGHVLGGEVEHHVGRGVLHHVEPVAAVLGAEACPVVGLVAIGVGHLVAGEVGDGVGEHHVGEAAHVFTAHGACGS